MSITVQDLLNSFGEKLLLQTSPDDAALENTISWVAPTELLDPTPFIIDNALVLTTGLNLVEGADNRFDVYVERLANAGVATALGFATGLSFRTVPHALRSAANKKSLPLLEIPYQTSFIEVSRAVAESTIADRYKLLKQGLAVHEQLAASLLNGGGLNGMIKQLARLTGGPAAVLDPHGRILVNSHLSRDWMPTLVDGIDQTHNIHKSPIMIKHELVAYLVLQIFDDSFDIHAVSYATTLLSLEMSRQQAELTGRRELVGQLIEDILAQRLSEQGAARRLSAFGVDATQLLTVLVASTRTPGRSIRHTPWRSQKLTDISSSIISSFIDDELVVIITEQCDGNDVAQIVYEQIRTIDAEGQVGIGGTHAGLPGLRLSYYEAKEANAGNKSGINRCDPFNLSTLLLVNNRLPTHDMAYVLLKPLIHHDQVHGSELLKTLRTYLQNSASIADSAKVLNLHRNSMRYRLKQINHLIDVDIASFAEQAKLWIALQALELES